ncbi:14826_t:CDS:2, partial [Funneliformis mosseae]
RPPNINTKFNSYQEIEHHFLIASLVYQISLLRGFKTILQFANVNAIIKGFKQTSLSSLGIAFMIIVLIVRSPVSSNFHKLVYALATHGVSRISLAMALQR